jgi:hypothetical protein
MGFNQIGGYTNVPGEIPWEIVAVYFLAASAIAIYLGRRGGGLRKFSTLDLVYIAVGGALAMVWEFNVGSLIKTPSFIDIGFYGRLFILLIVAALVRKVGAGMLTMFVFNLLSDQFHYGYGGEPMYFIYECLTYGLFIDLLIAFTGGKIFGVGITEQVGQKVNRKVGPVTVGAQTISPNMGGKPYLSPATLAVIEGAILGFLMAFPDPLFYGGFFNPFLYGGVVDWGRIVFNIATFIPLDTFVGALSGLVALRVSRVI